LMRISVRSRGNPSSYGSRLVEVLFLMTER